MWARRLSASVLALVMVSSMLWALAPDASADQGTKDYFGYRWTDSNPPAPQVGYRWVEISATGTDTGLVGDDNYVGPLPIGFTFRFYGIDYTQFYVSTNGLVTFDYGVWQPWNSMIPYPWDVNGMLAVFWDDLSFESSSRAYYQTLGSAPNRQLVVEWVNVVRLGSSNYMTFEAILNETGEIWFQYKTLNGETGDSCTVGIENSGGWVGTQYSWDRGVLHDALAIRFDVSPVMIGPDNEQMGQPGTVVYYWLEVDNNQGITDSFDIIYSSIQGWTVGLYDSMLNPLVDNNGNGVPDTGDVPPWDSTEIRVAVTIPAAPTANIEETTVIATSRADPGKWDDALLVTRAAGARFAPPHSDWPVDVDGNGLYDYLVVEARIYVRSLDSYYVTASFSDQYGNWLGSADDYFYLAPGPGTVQLALDGWRIRATGVDGPFYVHLDLYDGSGYQLDYDLHMTGAYSAADFEPPPIEFAPPHEDRGLDTGGDGLYNYLVIEVSLYVRASGYFMVWASLTDSHGRWIDRGQNETYLDAGAHVVELRYPGHVIRSHGVDGPYRANMDLYLMEDGGWYTWVQFDWHITGPYAWSDFNDVPASFSPPHSDRVVDNDGNGLYEYLVVGVTLDVPERCTVEVSSWLLDLFWNDICHVSNRTHVEAGLQTVELWFPGWEIKGNGVSGNFVVYMDLWDADGNWISWDIYTTAWYDHMGFQSVAMFSPPHSDRGLDTDGDGLYNYLVVDTVVVVLMEDDYYFDFGLQDMMFGMIWRRSNFSHLEPGVHTITWLVPGWLILGHGVNGPYWASFSVYWRGAWLDSGTHITRAYLYTQFNEPPAVFAPPHDDYGLDTDGNLLYDYLVVDVSVQVDIAGEYGVSGTLLDGFYNWIGWESSYTHLDAGLQVVQLRYRGWEINRNGYTGEYYVDLSLWDSNGERLDSDTHTTHPYSWSAFEPYPAVFAPPHDDYGLDTDGNGLYDYLVVVASVDVATAGTFRVYTDLYTPTWLHIAGAEVEVYLDAGLRTVELKFPGYIIRKAMESGNFIVRMSLYTGDDEYLDDGEHWTAWYDYDEFEYPPLEFVWPHGEYALDTDGDGLYEYLVVLASVDVRVAGNYWVAAIIGLGTGAAIRTNFTYLEVGHQIVELRVPGWQFVTNAVNGPYGVGLLALDETLRYQIDEFYFVTNPYRYTKFNGTVPSIESNWAAVPPTIDGVLTAGEWARAAVVDLSAVDPINLVDATMLVMNNGTHLFVAYDATGDITEDDGDVSSIGFDTGNDGLFTDGGEDQFLLSEIIRGKSMHLVYSSSHSDFEIDCMPFDDTLPGHAGLAGAIGFGSSDRSVLDHRMYEFAIPLALLGAAPGDVLGFLGGSVEMPGVYDESIDRWANWPVPVSYMASLADYGDLVLANLPVTRCSLDGDEGLNGWFVSNVTATLTASGGQGGVDYTMYRVDRGPWRTYTGPFAIRGEGVHTLEFYSVDREGNSEPVQSVTVRIDLRAPVTTAALAGTGAGEWWSSDVTVTLRAADGAGSGVAATLYQVDEGGWETYTGPFVVTGEGSHTVEFHSTDIAGREESLRSIAVNIETTPPTTSCVLAGTMGAEDWYTSAVTATLSAMDMGGSGVASTHYRLDGGMWLVYSAPVSVTATGTHTIEFYSVDRAGNVEGTRSVTFKVDAAAPTTAHTLSGTAGLAGWYTSSVTVTLSSSDGAGGSGVDEVKYRIGGGTWQTYAVAITVSAQGTTTIDYYATDNAGNVEATKSVTVKVDTLAPSSSASVEDGTVTLTATDATSGVARIEYRIDGGAWQNYTAPFEVTGKGNHTVEYRAVDNAGNVEATQTTYVEVEEAGGVLGGAVLWGIIAAVIVAAVLAALLLMRKRRAPGAPEEPPPPPDEPSEGAP